MTNSEAISRLQHHIEQGLARVLESMTGKQFSVSSERKRAPESPADSLIWQQTLSIPPNATLWFVAPRELWTMAGRLTLEAAGIGEIGDQECRSTWTEICGQAISAVAAGITADVGREVTAEQGSEGKSQPESLDWTEIGIRNPDGEVFLLMAAWSAEVNTLYQRAAAGESPHVPNDGAVSKTFDLLLDVALPVSVSFGRTSLEIREVLKLNTGSIVELDRLVSEPVDVIVNDCVIARGEVVVVEGNYGVRITQLASREDRLRSGMKEADKKMGVRT